jgi:dihydroflavonol-4-reductase
LEDAMQNTDAVIHAAAKVSFVSDERDDMMQTNIEGTANVVNTAIAQNIQRVVHVSSVAALGRTAGGETIDEEKKWQENKLNTNYAISKYNAEIEVWRAIGEGLNCAIVNPSTIIGYGDWNTSSCAIFKTVYEGFPWYTNGINGFVDVKDVASAIVLLMETDITGERFILNGENYSFKKLFDEIADGFHKKHPSREATPGLAEIAWRIEKIKSLFTHKPSLLTRESARVAQTKTYFDNSKFMKYLPGFSFTPLQQTIQQACKLYLQNVNPS